MDRVLLVATAAVSPIVLWVVARILAPDYFTLPDQRARIAVVTVVAAVAVLGYVAGRFNDRLLTCEDFRVAGDDLPKNCLRVEPQ
ncbi:hypothetical protein KBX37_29880 [Micromonospora sp. U56]|uniref:hypothetical protein n=1 Tax=Micromonospora sp. U56 TaxID=2824900 RepID=UPI001B38D7F6|nr:hypothetical protein [Micromonospora sp. U56]MBQ0897235.1 hypothetical protein [Micromonospora sp. U56]